VTEQGAVILRYDSSNTDLLANIAAKVLVLTAPLPPILAPPLDWAPIAIVLFATQLSRRATILAFLVGPQALITR